MMGRAIVDTLFALAASARNRLRGGTDRLATAPPTLGAATLRDYRAAAPRLYAALAKGVEGGFVMSPRALSTGLGMIYAGANASSRAAMAQALGWSCSAESLVVGHRHATATLQASLSRTTGASLHEAARLWVGAGYRVLPSFERLLVANYHFGTASVDFGHASAAAQTINQWVKEQTHAMIDHLVDRALLSPETRLVQTGALHVRAAWASGELAREAVPRTFASLRGGARQVHMLSSEAGLAYEDADLVMVSVDYQRDREGGGLAMTFVLPKSSVKHCEVRLCTDTLARIPALQPLLAVEVIFPEFAVAAGGELKQALAELGLTRIALDRISLEELELTAVVQQSRLKVDTKGTEGAAALAIVMAPTGSAEPRRQIVLDRPFLFAMHDKATGEILFMGRVTDP